MQIPITAFYAGVLAIFALYLSFRAGSFRGKAGVSVLFGDPPNMELAERVRVHQNFLEYVPMILILMGAIELNGGSTTFLHGIGIALIISRIAHAIGLKHDNMGHPGRLIGAGGTMLITLIVAGYAIWYAGGALVN
ncbi:MAG: MAPEG family protein [Gammaproteobacteria bacterium]|nr:MAPEG family protein [Gammaproteobacteria bacterium]MDH3372832.1 MAPEG family protein [Gammaproteobacteria bacterium]MDH3407986.1 MAPEG family protein [Gammaproteobacteria bacterium]MDH3551290.1 MAPEG family protein [Gammaproteobacteria bacterium]